MEAHRRAGDAQDYPACLEILRDLVQPERAKCNRKVYRERWWQYAERQGELSLHLESSGSVPPPRVSKHRAFSFVSTSIVMSEATVVILTDQREVFSLLQSSIHVSWAENTNQASKLGAAIPRPTASKRTFPYPPALSGLRELGELYIAARQRIMTAGQLGLTETYSLLHDPHCQEVAIDELRECQQAVDAAVAQAYGGPRFELGHGFHETKQGMRFTVSEQARRNILARLLKLNHDRYDEEVNEGLHKTDWAQTRTNAASPTQARQSRAAGGGKQGTLL